jgi:hypothetical protein
MVTSVHGCPRPNRLRPYRRCAAVVKENSPRNQSVSARSWRWPNHVDATPYPAIAYRLTDSALPRCPQAVDLLSSARSLCQSDICLALRKPTESACLPPPRLLRPVAASCHTQAAGRGGACCKMGPLAVRDSRSGQARERATLHPFFPTGYEVFPNVPTRG